MIVISAYAPHDERPNAERDVFYASFLEDLENLDDTVLLRETTHRLQLILGEL